MFENSNLHLLLGASLPAFGYLAIIYTFGRDLISWKSSIVYILFGFLSVIFLMGIHFVFPHIQDVLFANAVVKLYKDGNFEIFQEPTVWSLLMFCFIQIALIEELSKAGTFKIASLPRRHKTRYEKDSLFAVMFYSCCVAAGFAVVENVKYAQDVLFEYGDLPAQYVTSNRSVFSVLSHMIAGLIIGYSFAVSRIKKGFSKIAFPIIGIGCATLYHGLFNYLLYISDEQYDIKINDFISIHPTSTILMILGLGLTFLLGAHLRSYSRRYNKVLQKQKLQHPRAKKAESNL